MKTKHLVICVFAVAVSTTAQAIDWSTGGAQVKALEATYLPQNIAFQIDRPGGNVCPSGTWLIYPAQGATADDRSHNSRATYATLLVALASGKRVNVFGTNDCKVQHIHILQ